MVKTKRLKKTELEQIEEIIYKHGGRRISKTELKNISLKNKKLKRIS